MYKVVYSVVFHLSEMRVGGRRSNNVGHIYSLANKVATILNKKLEITKKDIIKHINLRPALPMTIFKGLNKEEVATCLEYYPPIQGLEVVANPERIYPYNNIGCHFIGYTGIDDPGTAPDRKDYSYYVPDVKGRSGVEKLFDKKIDIGGKYRGLRGKPGSELLRVNVKGYVYNDLGVSISPKMGNNIVLTINWRAQKIAEKLLEGKIGSFILVDADNGNVEALVSSPGFNPNDFTNGISRTAWAFWYF